MKRDDHVLVIIPPSVALFSTVYAILRLGAVAVFIDSNATRRTQLKAALASNPVAVIGPASLVTAHRVARPRTFTCSFEQCDDGTILVPELNVADSDPVVHTAPRDDDETAFITFTSGTTGSPKGVPRTHGLLRRQHETIQANFPLPQNSVALVGFPMLGVHTLSIGCTAALVRAMPLMTTNEIVELMRLHEVTSAGVAPAMWRALLDVLDDNDCPQLGVIGTGGSPVPLSVAYRLRQRFPTAERHITYGSSEAEPIARISMDDMLHAVELSRQAPRATHRGGYPVGSGVPEVDVRLIAPSTHDRDDHGFDDRLVSPGQIGEVIVHGDNVVKTYLGDAEATRTTKIIDTSGRVWHRTGDLAFVDESDMLWLVGRCGDELQAKDGSTVYPYPVEREIDALPGVLVSALIAHRARPHGEVIIHEAPGQCVDVVDVANVLKEFDLQMPIVRMHIPVDRRIRSKIDRKLLRAQREGLLLPIRSKMVHLTKHVLETTLAGA